MKWRTESGRGIQSCASYIFIYTYIIAAYRERGGIESNRIDKGFELGKLNMKKRQVVVKRNVAGNTSDSSSSSAAAREGRIIRYGECQKNHAAYSGGYAVDGCREFMPGVGEEAALTCAACGCHRNFHKKEVLRTAQ